MHIIPLETSHIDEAACLFAADFRRLRQGVPTLPAHMEAAAPAAGRLAALLKNSSGLAACEGGRLVGYMAWWVIDGFRDTPRRVGYVPAWAHAAAPGMEQAATAALYRAASCAWHEAGCHAHAITLLAGDPLTHSFWFWNGFGALVVDAVRPALPLGVPAPAGFSLRKATPTDAALLAELETEHWQHYGQPPVLMMANNPSSVEECAALLNNPENRVWLAFDGQQAMGYVRFEGSSHGAAEVVEDAPGRTTAITGAYVRAAYRGRGAAPAMLDAAMRDFASAGTLRCAVDFESFNPQASALWMKYFTPVCLSVMRVPEKS